MLRCLYYFRALRPARLQQHVASSYLQCNPATQTVLQDYTAHLLNIIRYCRPCRAKQMLSYPAELTVSFHSHTQTQRGNTCVLLSPSFYCTNNLWNKLLCGWCFYIYFYCFYTCYITIYLLIYLYLLFNLYLFYICLSISLWPCWGCTTISICLFTSCEAVILYDDH